MVFPFSNKIGKCCGSCNNINNPYAKLYVPNARKKLNIKVFNLMSKTKEAKHIKWHETCKSECRLNSSAYNDKQHWNNDRCRYECKRID